MDEALVRVLASAELADSAIRQVRVDGGDVLLARLPSGQVVAFATTCPHQRTELDGADLVDGLVRCPLHAYAYDPRTGANVEPARHADPGDLWKLLPGYLPVFPVDERDGWVWVGRTPRPPPASYDPALERPPAPETPPPVEPLARSTGVVRVPAGATFELRLPTTPRAGFVWRIETAGPLLAVVGQRAERGEHVVRLTARGAGRATVRCLYARPWDRGPAEVRTYEVVVYS